MLQLIFSFLCFFIFIASGYAANFNVGDYGPDGGAVKIGNCVAKIPNFFGELSGKVSASLSTFQCINGLAEGPGNVVLSLETTNGHRYKMQYVGNMEKGLPVDERGFFAFSKDGDVSRAFVGKFEVKPNMSRMLIYTNVKDMWMFYRVTGSGNGKFTTEVVRHPANTSKTKLPPQLVRYVGDSMLYEDNLNRSSTERDAGFMSIEQLVRTYGMIDGLEKAIPSKDAARYPWAF